jgi:hypothetical protein
MYYSEGTELIDSSRVSEMFFIIPNLSIPKVKIISPTGSGSSEKVRAACLSLTNVLLLIILISDNFMRFLGKKSLKELNPHHNSTSELGLTSYRRRLQQGLRALIHIRTIEECKGE